LRRVFVPALAIATLLPLAGRARGDDFSDFRIPTHQALSWTGNFDGTWRGSTSDDVTSRVRSGLIYGTTSSDFLHLTDGENGFTDLVLSALLQGGRSSNRRSGYQQSPVLASGFDQRSSARSTDERWEIDYSFGRYVGGAPFVLGADARALGIQSQFWSVSRDASSQTDFVSSTDQWIESSNRRLGSAITASLRPRVGIGRVRDATWVYTARVIEDRLRHDGVLTRALTHEARQKLADLLTLGDAYDVLHARPAKGLWAEIERVLRDDGALAPGGLDASSTQHAGESLLEAVSRGRRADGLPGTIVLRQRGASASAFVSGLHQRETRSNAGGSRSQLTLDGVPQPIVSSSFSDRLVRTSDGVDAGLEAEWHRPVGLRVQLDVSAEASVPLRSQDDGLAANMNGQATWMVADRWLVQGTVSQQRDILQNARDGRTRQDSWGLFLAGQVSYEVEDHVTISLGLQDVQTGQRDPDAGPPLTWSYRRETTVTLGLTYRFTGRFNAPGFEALSRTTRPAAGI
jgi:hypothetical protein